VTYGSQATKAAKDATATTPIVFVGVASPVEAGLVASLARPGGNVTGATDQAGELLSKQLQLITETVPKSSRIGVLGDAANPDA
jgi:putative ABC transport system substrate-binding protein